MDLPIQSIESLRAEGRVRGQAGAPSSANPFLLGTEHHRQWDLGHIDGEVVAAELLQQHAAFALALLRNWR